jgi:hypothetical protein
MARGNEAWALNAPLPVAQQVVEVVRPQVRVRYSAVARTETPLPQGLRPVSVGSRTGALLVGDRVFAHRSEIERTVAGSLAFVREVAAALPVDEADERIVEDLLATRTAGLNEQRLRGRKERER